VSETPEDEGPDGLTARYRRASEADPSRASEAVREAILAHARSHADRARPERSGTVQRGADRRRTPRRSWPIWGAAAAAAITGLIALPLYREAGVIGPPPPATAPAPGAEPRAALAPAATEAQEPVPPGPPPKAPRPEPHFTAAAPPAADAPGAAVTPFSRGATAARERASDAGTADRAAKPAAAAPAANAARAPFAARDRLAEAPKLQGRSQLHAATASGGEVAEAQRHLQAGLALETRDEAGRTPLLLAVLHADRPLVRTLLAQGADPNAADGEGRTPLAIARARHDTEMVQALEGAGAR
jgi:uncharacterized protein